MNGQSISGAAREVGVTETSLRRWISKYNTQFNTVESSSEDHELLKKRLQKLISERSTLKASLLTLLKEQIKIEENEGSGYET